MTNRLSASQIGYVTNMSRDRSVQLLKRVQMEPEYTLIGGILRFGTLVARVVSEKLKANVNMPEDSMAQYTTALGAAILGHQRLGKLK